MPPPCSWLVGMVLTYLDATPAPPPRPGGRATGGAAPTGPAAPAAAESLPASTGRLQSDPAGPGTCREHKQALNSFSWLCSTSSSTLAPCKQMQTPIRSSWPCSTSSSTVAPCTIQGRLWSGGCTPQQASCSSSHGLLHVLQGRSGIVTDSDAFSTVT